MWRFIEVIFWLAAGSTIFTFVAFQLNLNLMLTALIGALCGVFIWLFINFNRSNRYLDWIRSGDLSQIPKLNGVWGEVTARS